MRLLLSFICLVLFTAPVQAKRVALVIGNDDYVHIKVLEKAVNDAKAVAAKLAEMDFDVVHQINVDRDAMSQVINDFSAKIEAGDEVVFYYAGHGVAVNGQNYYLPTDIRKEIPNLKIMLPKEAFAEDDLIKIIQDRNAKVGILIIDACRDNPLTLDGRSTSERGGLLTQEAPDGFFVLYSAGKFQQALDNLGKTDRNLNSVFTRKLLPLLSTPGLSITNLAKTVKIEVKNLLAKSPSPYREHKQSPAYYDQIIGNFYFIPPAKQEPQKQVEIKPAFEEIIWSRVEKSNNPDDFRFYLSQFPDGKYKQVAINKILTFESESNVVAKPEGPIKEAVGQQNAEYHYKLGRKLLTEKDENSALKNLLLAAKQDHPVAMWDLAYLYLEGPKDLYNKKKGIYWLERADAHGVAMAKHGLIYARAKDENGKTNFSQVFKKSLILAKNGDPFYMHSVGLMYHNGNGVRKNDRNAYFWFNKAAQKEHAKAMYMIGNFYSASTRFNYSKGTDIKKEIYWYRKSAEKGVIDSMLDLAERLDHGSIGLDRHGNPLNYPYRPKEAAKWVVAAAKVNPDSVMDLFNSPESWTGEFLRSLQLRLKEANVYQGDIDGRFGPQTKTALYSLEKAD